VYDYIIYILYYVLADNLRRSRKQMNFTCTMSVH